MKVENQSVCSSAQVTGCIGARLSLPRSLLFLIQSSKVFLHSLNNRKCCKLLVQSFLNESVSVDQPKHRKSRTLIYLLVAKNSPYSPWHNFGAVCGDLKFLHSKNNILSNFLHSIQSFPSFDCQTASILYYFRPVLLYHEKVKTKERL